MSVSDAERELLFYLAKKLSISASPETQAAINHLILMAERPPPAPPTPPTKRNFDPLAWFR